MRVSPRLVLPETLDFLAPDDPRAARSRRDLRRVHRAMRTVSIVKQALAGAHLTCPPRRVLELGGGDASLVLRLAQALRPHWPHVSLAVLDRHDVVATQTRAAYRALGWELQVTRQEALEWAAAPHSERYDLCICTLFLHHFDEKSLPGLLHAIAASCDAFIACEPRRSALSRLGSRMVAVLGANQVTREDAVTSVAAGFKGRELTALWPRDGRWSCREYAAFPFTHCFAAVRGGAEDIKLKVPS